MLREVSSSVGPITIANANAIIITSNQAPPPPNIDYYMFYVFYYVFRNIFRFGEVEAEFRWSCLASHLKPQQRSGIGTENGTDWIGNERKDIINIILLMIVSGLEMEMGS